MIALQELTTLFDGLTDGDYTFSVFAADPAGNADPSPATWDFTVAVVPDTTIDDAVDGDKHQYPTVVPILPTP